MAVLSYDLTDEERKRLAEQTGGVPSSEAGASAPAPGTEAGSNVPTPPTELKSPQAAGRSPWVDVGSYLDANKEQAQTLAGNVAGDLTAQGAGLRSDIDTAKSKFLGNVAQGSTLYDEDLMNRAVADPAKLTAEERAKVKAIRDASYGGPESFIGSDDYTGLTGRVSEAANRAKGVDTEAGREAILTSVGTNPTKGQTAFNQLLIGANPDARSKLSAAAKPFEDLNTYLDTAATSAGEAATKGRSDTAAARARANDAIGGASNTFQAGVNQRLAAARQDAMARANAAKSGFTGYVAPTPAAMPEIDPTTGNPLPVIEPSLSGLDAQQLADLGISKEDADAIKQSLGLLSTEHGRKDFQFDPYFTQRSPDVDITAGNVASAEDYARQAALEDLMGSQTGFLNPADASKAGTANLDVLDFQGQRFGSDAESLLKSLDEQVFNDVSAPMEQRLRISQRRGWGTPPSAPVEPGEPKSPPILDLITDPTVVGPAVEEWVKPITGETGAEIIGGGTGAVTIPTKVGKDVLDTVIDTHTDLLNPDDTAKDIYHDIKNPGEAIKDIGNKVADEVKSLNPFCFSGDTLVNMADGSQKPIRLVALGEATAGGPVVSMRQSLTPAGTLYEYEGILVTGRHAVKENGGWIRVSDSPKAKKLEPGLIVHSLVTADHRIFVGDIEFADEVESDHYEDLTIDESLDYLNGKLVIEETAVPSTNGFAEVA